MSWFSPLLLLRTLAQLLVARLFARYADRRERDAGRPHDGPYDCGEDELWLDYVADLGDGFAATTTIASLIAAAQLPVQGRSLPHARVLLMGGDLAYPAASREAYRDRLECPYYSVLPQAPAEAPRALFALPGNHDWYDGLAAFSRLFLQRRWFAGWRTRQSRSCFVLRLPQRWWLVAVDVQLDGDVDLAQRDYLLAATAAIRPGDGVILVAAAPWWLAEPGSRLRRNMEWLQRVLVQERGASTRLALSGDLHHYSRYADADGGQRIVAGGGGAFLHGTAWQPRALADGSRRAVAWPSPARSRLLAWRLLLFPLLNPGLSLLLGGTLALLAWLANVAGNGILFHTLAQVPLASAALAGFVEALPWSPALLLGVVALYAGAVAFVDGSPACAPRRQGALRLVAGSLHATAQLWLMLSLLPVLLPASVALAHPVLHLLALAGLLLGLSLGAGLLFGAYLFLAWQLAGLHRDTAFAAMRIDDWKHFLRLHIGADGILQVYAIGVPRVCRRWRTRRAAAAGEALVEPADGLAPGQRLVLVDSIRVSRVPAGGDAAPGGSA